jgi:lysozyme
MSAILPVPNALLGIDVSHWQGNIDWVKVAKSGVKFTYIKATEGLTGDPMVNVNCHGARESGIPFGLYHLWKPDRPAIEQYALFSAALEALSPQLPAALDIEPGAITADGQENALEWLSDWPKLPLVYVAPSEAQIHLTDPAWLQYPLWIAHYTEAEKPNTVKWPTWTFWQRQSDGEVPGITGAVDIDWFNGSEEDFQRLIVPT